VNNHGQLGNGTTVSSMAPVAVSGLSNAQSVAAGYDSYCALLTDKTLKCWGANMFGQLGNGNTTDSSVPVVVSGLTNVSSVSVGDTDACALLPNGTAKCWGFNADGHLGNGTTINSLAPVTVSGLNTATSIAVGSDSTCATLSNHTVQCWGTNLYGQLGDGSSDYSETRLQPGTTVSNLNQALSVSGSLYGFYCALLSNGVACWGQDRAGSLGDGFNGYRVSPVTVHLL